MYGACGGCLGLGSHKRWCHQTVGSEAAKLGEAAERAEGMGDAIGIPEAANVLWGASARLRAMAERSRDEWRELNQKS